MPDFEDGPKLHDSYVGGTGGAYYRDGMTIWTGWVPRMISLAPGQTVSRTIDDVGEHFFYHPCDEGSYTLTATHPRGPCASVSFRIILDEAGRAWRTVPNGAIRGNRNVVRKIGFPVLATNKIRVVVFNALGGETILEYELDFGDDGDTYEWEFDPKKPRDQPKLRHTHVYEKEGTYTVKLRLVDNNNDANEITMVVNVIAKVF